MLYLKQNPERQSFELQRALSAAEGYLYLGMPSEAIEELKALPMPEHRNSAVMRSRIRALLHMKKWMQAERLSQRGAALYPDENEFVVQRAFALHQLDKGNEALDAIMSAPEWLRRTGILHYNLACYEAQLGDITAARECIREAIELNASFKKNARSDPDLKGVWN
jgi:predicted Zn-dependent protease